jgi:hypothetical protein
MSAKHNEKKKECMPKCKKLMEKNISSKIINLHDIYIYIILINSNIFNSLVKLHSSFVFD